MRFSSMRSDKELALEELARRTEATGVAQEQRFDLPKDFYGLEEKRPVSALRGLLDAIPEQPKAKPTASALTGLLDGTN